MILSTNTATDPDENVLVARCLSSSDTVMINAFLAPAPPHSAVMVSVERARCTLVERLAGGSAAGLQAWGGLRAGCGSPTGPILQRRMGILGRRLRVSNRPCM